MFAVLEAARELKLKEQAGIMVELVDIAAVPNQPLQYMKSLKNTYQRMSDRAVPEHQVQQKKTEGTIPWDTASNLMWSAMKTMKRLNRG